MLSLRPELFLSGLPPLQVIQLNKLEKKFHIFIVFIALVYFNCRLYSVRTLYTYTHSVHIALHKDNEGGGDAGDRREKGLFYRMKKRRRRTIMTT